MKIICYVFPVPPGKLSPNKSARTRWETNIYEDKSATAFLGTRAKETTETIIQEGFFDRFVITKQKMWTRESAFLTKKTGNFF